MISAILSKLLTSVFKAVSYRRFLKLAVGCLDVSFCLLSGLNLIRLMMSAAGLFMVNPSEKWIFLSACSSGNWLLLCCFALFLKKRSPQVISWRLNHKFLQAIVFHQKKRVAMA